VIDFRAAATPYRRRSDPVFNQKNFILGIGDVNTHADSNLPERARHHARATTCGAEVSGDSR
jgi:hypothetical protein